MTLGSVAAVRGYLSAMWREMSEKRYSPDCLRHDQAFHNWLLWSGALGAGVRACSAERGPVSTIGWPEHLYRDRYGRVLNRAGEVAHVVHQFDRRKQLVDSLGSPYFYNFRTGQMQSVFPDLQEVANSPLHLSFSS